MENILVHLEDAVEDIIADTLAQVPAPELPSISSVSENASRMQEIIDLYYNTTQQTHIDLTLFEFDTDNAIFSYADSYGPSFKVPIVYDGHLDLNENSRYVKLNVLTGIMSIKPLVDADFSESEAVTLVSNYLSTNGRPEHVSTTTGPFFYNEKWIIIIENSSNVECGYAGVKATWNATPNNRLDPIYFNSQVYSGPRS